MSLCHYVLKTTPVFFCHYIILSKNHTYLPLSLCHYVLKKTPVSPRPHVTLSSKPPHLLLPELVHLLPCLSHTLSYPSPLLLSELVHLLPCLSHTLSCPSPLLLPELVHLLPCLPHTLSYPSPLLLPELVHLLPCLPHTLSYPSPPCYSQNLFICYPVSFIPSVHRPYSPVSLPALKILTENIEHLTGLLLTLHVITKNMTIRLICMSFRV